MVYKPKWHKNKYHAIKTELDGIEFDSRHEADVYAELKMLEKGGAIKDLEILVTGTVKKDQQNAMLLVRGMRFIGKKWTNTEHTQEQRDEKLLFHAGSMLLGKQKEEE